MDHDGTQEELQALEQEAIRVGVLGPKGNVNGVDPDTLAHRVAFHNPFFDSPYIDAISGIEKTRARAETQEQDVSPPADEAEPSDDSDDAPAERKRPDKIRKPKPTKDPKPPHKGGLFVMLYDHDADRILQSPDPSAVNALALWYVLSRMARSKRELTFEAADGYLAKAKVPTGMKSPKTVRRAADLLYSLGLLESKSCAIPGREIRTPQQRTIRPAGDILGKKGGVKSDADEISFT